MRRVPRVSGRGGWVAGPLTLLFVACSLAGSPTHAQTIAITGGTVYPVSGPPLENGTVLIRDGEIVAVGANASVPANARRVDARGRWVTPGLINAATQIGLVEIGAVRSTSDGSDGADDVAAAFDVVPGINPASQLIAVTRVAGVTTVVAGPSGGLISGQAVAVDLWGERVEDMLVRAPVGMVAHINEDGAETTGGSRAAALERLERVLDDARAYSARAEDFARGQMYELAAPAPDLGALIPVLEGRVPLMLTAQRRADIENAVRLASEYNVRMIIRGGAEAWQAADRLAGAGIPVMLDPMNIMPSYDGLSARSDNAALLSQAGVTVVLASFDSHNARNIRQSAGNAVAAGMTWAAALQSITLDAARVLGIGDRYGSLEPGRVANVVVWTGDPFEFSTTAEHVFIRGNEVPMTSRQRELLERYRTLPPEYFKRR